MGKLTRLSDTQFNCEILGAELFLFKEGGRWSLTDNAMERTVVLDTSEANAAFRLAQSSAGSIQIAGLDDDDELPVDLSRVRDQIPSEDAILLDTTTLFDASLAIKDGPSPFTLLDLSTIANAFSLFENVVIQGPKTTAGVIKPLKRTLGSALTILNYDQDFVVDRLWEIYAPLADDLSPDEGPLISAITDAWRTFLSKPDIVLHKRFLKKLQNSPRYWDGVPATHYIGRNLGLDPEADKESLNEFVTVQTMRALFNDNLAGLLHVPYVPTSLRSPIYTELLRSKLEVQLLADKLLAALGPPILHELKPGPYAAELSAPFLLGILLSRITKPEDFWPALLELRQQLAPLRERLRLDRHDWHGRSANYLAEYLKHLKGYTPPSVQFAGQVVSGTATLGASVATASPLGGGAAKLLIKLVEALKPAEKAYQIYLRRFKPHVHVLVELDKEARALRSAETDIERLWKSSWTRHDHDVLEALSLSRPEMYSRLRQVG
jgi:hypothetical protein